MWGTWNNRKWWWKTLKNCGWDGSGATTSTRTVLCSVVSLFWFWTSLSCLLVSFIRGKCSLEFVIAFWGCPFQLSSLLEYCSIYVLNHLTNSRNRVWRMLEFTRIHPQFHIPTCEHVVEVFRYCPTTSWMVSYYLSAGFPDSYSCTFVWDCTVLKLTARVEILKFLHSSNI